MIARYAGAVGYLGFGGDMDTCIALRTMVLRAGIAYASHHSILRPLILQTSIMTMFGFPYALLMPVMSTRSPCANRSAAMT